MSEAFNLSTATLMSNVAPTAWLFGLNNGVIERYRKNAVFVKRPMVSDFNEAVHTGYYPVNTTGSIKSFANAPSSSISFGVLLVFDDATTENEEFVQILLTVTAVPAMYIRKKGTSSGWSVWQKMASSAVGGGNHLCNSRLRFSRESGGRRAA